MFDGLQYYRAISKIKAGGTGDVSYAMICNASINLLDAKNKLTEDQFLGVKKLYDDFMTCKTKYSVDLDGWWKLTKEVIDKFDEIAPYEKYFGGNEFEMSMLQKNRKKDELNNQISEEGKKYIDYLVETGARAEITRDEATDIYLIIKTYHEAGKEKAFDRIHVLFDDKIKRNYPPVMWGSKIGYICGVLESNAIISEQEGDRYIEDANHQMIFAAKAQNSERQNS